MNMNIYIYIQGVKKKLPCRNMEIDWIKPMRKVLYNFAIRAIVFEIKIIIIEQIACMGSARAAAGPAWPLPLWLAANNARRAGSGRAGSNTRGATRGAA